MDKQTAIDLLDNLLGMVEDNHESDYDTAIKMGIDALQSNAPNVLSALDCVERQAAVDAIRAKDDYSNVAVAIGLGKAMTAICELPSVQTNLQLTCNKLATDCIDRHTAIDALEERLKVNGYSNVALVSELNRCIGYLMRLPSVQPQRWIPVTEALPEKPFGCLVTVMDTEPMTMEEFENLLPYFVGYDGEQWNDSDGEQCPFEVIAWMPLPPVYEGGKDE